MKELFYKITALMILVVFYGCYVIKMHLQRRKGIRTDQMGKGKTGTARRIEIVVKTAAVLAPAAELFSIFLSKQMPSVVMRTAGIIIGVIGDAVFIVSVVTMKDSWRAGVSETDSTDLVTNGIYSVSRNPAFLGFDLVYIGILCLYCNLILLIVTAFAIVMFHLQIVCVEEKFLLRTFGDEYAQYAKHVKRYLGRK